MKGNTITNYETGLRNPSEAVLKSICREFNVSEEWLRYGTGDMFIELDRDEELTAWASKITRTDFDNQFVPEFVHMLSKLDEDDWETLEKIAKMLNKRKTKLSLSQPSPLHICISVSAPYSLICGLQGEQFLF